MWRTLLPALGLLSCLAGPVRSDEAPAPLDHPAALEALHADDAPLRRRALLVLEAAGTMDDVPSLLPVLRDDDEPARAMAERAIWRIWSRSGDAAVDAQLEEGIAMMADGRLNDSVGVFSRIVAAHPEFAEGWNKRATAYYLLGDYDRSLADCDAVMARNPFHFGALSGYGLIHLRQRRYALSLEFFQRALAINPNMPMVERTIEALEKALATEGRQKI